jgi:hypothetical protein
MAGSWQMRILPFGAFLTMFFLLASSVNSQMIPFAFWRSPCRTCPAGYGAGFKLTYNVRPASSLTAFPNLIVSTNALLADVAHGGKVLQTATLNGQTVPTDLVFTSDAAGSNVLSWEIESWDNTTGALKAWVKFDRSSTSDDVVYLWVGKNSLTTYQGSSTDTWSSGFQGVWHLPNGTSLSTYDSTANGNNGTTVTAYGAAAGKIGGGGTSTASNSGIMVGSGASLNITSAPLTVSAWIYANSFGGGGKGYIFCQNTSGGPVFAFTLENSGTTKGLQLYINPTGVYSSANVIDFAAWYHVAVTYSGTTASFFVNGVAAGTATNSNTFLTTGIGAEIGNLGNGGRNFDGVLDEVRVANVARSADWIAHEYAQQAQASAWYTMVQVP